MPCPGLRDRGPPAREWRPPTSVLAPAAGGRWCWPGGRRGAGELGRGLQPVGLPPSAGPAAQGPRWGGHYMPGTHKGSPSPKPEDKDACPVSCAQ